jgi:hypothetical protein
MVHLRMPVEVSHGSHALGRGETLSKWFYDISPGTATRVARRGSLIGGTKALNAHGVSYEGTWRT